jgi:hypothetical protein
VRLFLNESTPMRELLGAPDLQGVTINTLRSHTRCIFTKLEVTTRRAAVRRARERGLM